MEDRRFHGPKDYLDAGCNADTSPQELRALAESEYVFVRLAVAENLATPTDVLRVLVPAAVDTWNEQAMMLALSKNPHTPPDALDRVARLVPPCLQQRDAQQAFHAGVTLFQRDDIPDAVLQALLDDPRVTTEFRKVVARETTRPAVLDRLRSDPSERVRRAAARRL